MKSDLVHLLADIMRDEDIITGEDLLELLKHYKQVPMEKYFKKTTEVMEKRKNEKKIREEQKAKIENLLNQYISYCNLKAPEVPLFADMKARYFGKYSSIKDFGVAMFNMIYGNKVPPELWKFFDFEKYGETFTKDYVIGEGGYVFYVGDGPLNA